MALTFVLPSRCGLVFPSLPTAPAALQHVLSALRGFTYRQRRRILSQTCTMVERQLPGLDVDQYLTAVNDLRRDPEQGLKSRYCSGPSIDEEGDAAEYALRFLWPFETDDQRAILSAAFDQLDCWVDAGYVHENGTFFEEYGFFVDHNEWPSHRRVSV